MLHQKRGRYWKIHPPYGRYFLRPKRDISLISALCLVSPSSHLLPHDTWNHIHWLFLVFVGVLAMIFSSKVYVASQAKMSSINSLFCRVWLLATVLTLYRTHRHFCSKPEAPGHLWLSVMACEDCTFPFQEVNQPFKRVKWTHVFFFQLWSDLYGI